MLVAALPVQALGSLPERSTLPERRPLSSQILTAVGYGGSHGVEEDGHDFIEGPPQTPPARGDGGRGSGDGARARRERAGVVEAVVFAGGPLARRA